VNIQYDPSEVDIQFIPTNSVLTLNLDNQKFTFVSIKNEAETVSICFSSQKGFIVGSERYSAHTVLTNRNCVFFGDGAGAVILGESKNGWLVSHLASNGKETGMTGFKMPLDLPFEQKGSEVWNQAIRVLPESIKEVLNKAQLIIDDISLLIPHQPSINILKLVSLNIGLPIEKVKMIMYKYGNVAGASIPIALDDAMKSINKRLSMMSYEEVQ
jgi:3-oxoacyl-[acyl-carrier-protein] synthase III